MLFNFVMKQEQPRTTENGNRAVGDVYLGTTCKVCFLIPLSNVLDAVALKLASRVSNDSMTEVAKVAHITLSYGPFG